MSNEKTLYQLLLERAATNPELREKALSITPEEFCSLLKENGLTDIDSERAALLQGRLKDTFEKTNENLSDEQLFNVSGGIMCAGVTGCN